MRCCRFVLWFVGRDFQLKRSLAQLRIIVAGVARNLLADEGREVEGGGFAFYFELGEDEAFEVAVKFVYFPAVAFIYNNVAVLIDGAGQAEGE